MKPKPSLWSRIFGRGRTLSPAGAIARLAGRPMAMSPASLDVLIASAQAMPKGEAYREDDDWSPEGSQPEHLIDIQNGIGVLKVHGPLFQRWDMWAWWFGGTGYDVIAAALQQLRADDGVKSIVLDVDSPGGDCAGCPDLADAIFAGRAVKPISAIVNDMGYSAAYFLASAAQKVTLTRTAGVGSVGVIATHVDVSQWDKNAGVKYEFIFAGDKKADYNMHEPLAKGARKDLQDEVDRLYAMFVEGVARNRGIDADAVRATQAGCYFGPGAVSAKLADEVATFEVALDALMDGDGAAADLPPVVDDQPAPIDDDAKSAAAAQPPAAAAPAAEAQPPPAAAAQESVPEALTTATLVAALTAAHLPDPVFTALVKRNKIDQPVAEQISTATAICDICAAASLPDVAAGYIERGVNIETIRAELQAVVQDDPKTQVSTTLPGMGGIHGGTSASGLWGTTIKRFGGSP